MATLKPYINYKSDKNIVTTYEVQAENGIYFNLDKQSNKVRIGITDDRATLNMRPPVMYKTDCLPDYVVHTGTLVSKTSGKLRIDFSYPEKGSRIIVNDFANEIVGVYEVSSEGDMESQWTLVPIDVPNADQANYYTTPTTKLTHGMAYFVTNGRLFVNSSWVYISDNNVHKFVKFSQSFDNRVSSVGAVDAITVYAGNVNGDNQIRSIKSTSDAVVLNCEDDTILIGLDTSKIKIDGAITRNDIISEIAANRQKFTSKSLIITCGDRVSAGNNTLHCDEVSIEYDSSPILQKIKDSETKILENSKSFSQNLESLKRSVDNTISVVQNIPVVKICGSENVVVSETQQSTFTISVNNVVTPASLSAAFEKYDYSTHASLSIFARKTDLPKQKQVISESEYIKVDDSNPSKTILKFDDSKIKFDPAKIDISSLKNFADFSNDYKQNIKSELGSAKTELYTQYGSLNKSFKDLQTFVEKNTQQNVQIPADTTSKISEAYSIAQSLNTKFETHVKDYTMFKNKDILIPHAKLIEKDRDDHPQYLNINGRPVSQTICGASTNGGHLYIKSNNTKVPGTVYFSDETTSVDYKSGAIVVSGGVGIRGNLNVESLATFNKINVGTINGIDITQLSSNLIGMTSQISKIGADVRDTNQQFNMLKSEIESQVQSYAVRIMERNIPTIDESNLVKVAGNYDGQKIYGGCLPGAKLILASTSHDKKGTVMVDDSIISNSPTSGSFVTNGGIGCGGNIHANGEIHYKTCYGEYAESEVRNVRQNQIPVGVTCFELTDSQMLKQDFELIAPQNAKQGQIIHVFNNTQYNSKGLFEIKSQTGATFFYNGKQWRKC